LNNGIYIRKQVAVIYGKCEHINPLPNKKKENNSNPIFIKINLMKTKTVLLITMFATAGSLLSA